ncbi:hypothetical protein CVIRNUC_007196 [Coccomyxa viridis]|uniref:Extracellular protein n=1 Tax=Coccomyxa viridis TaxID=1274662 RepID=A0AAV1I9D5_9CHLO|nr:hypothetical protein CVIRNUC_007196 [Coccomyxa viridis]
MMGLVVLPLASVLTAMDISTSGGGNQPADSAFTIVEKYVITSEEAYSCEEPEETIVLLAKARTAPAELLTGLSASLLADVALGGASSA